MVILGQNGTKTHNTYMKALSVQKEPQKVYWPLR